jgi:hypothetical protein
MPVAQAVDVKQDLENTKNKISIFILTTKIKIKNYFHVD